MDALPPPPSSTSCPPETAPDARYAPGMDIRGRVALVTGGGKRLGRAIALGLASAGADVFVHYRRSAEEAEQTVAEIRRGGSRAAAGAMDLADPAQAPALIAAAGEALGPVSILINSASGFPVDSLDGVTVDQWRRTQDLTLATPVFLTQAFAAALPDGERGAVVNLTDVRTMKPYRTHFSYVVAKGGIDTFTRAAALALAPRIRVNAVALGVILPPPGEDAAFVESLAADLPLPWAGGPDPVVQAVRSLILNDFVTGEVVRVDGGGHLV
jgi:NAD(P)-dependent dehydrogenase (short-subunit alcohol dehydrogenase family)